MLNKFRPYPYCVDHADEHVDCAVKVAEALNDILRANNFRLNWVVLHMARAIKQPVAWYDMKQACTHLTLFAEEKHEGKTA